MSAVEPALESAILQAVAADPAVQVSLGDPLRIAGAESPLPYYPYLEIVRRQSQPFDSAGCESFIVTIDMAVVARDEGGLIAQSAMADVRAALRAADLPMTGWRCVVLTQAFADTFRQAIGRWRSILRLRAVVEAVS